MKVWTSVTTLALLLYAAGAEGFAQRRAKPKRDAAKTRAAAKRPSGSTPLLDAACAGRWGEAESLLAAGADPNVGWMNLHGVPYTPLGCAVRAKNVEMVDALIAAGAEINPKNNFPPLLFALDAGLGPDDSGMVGALIARGADVNLRWHRGITFLMLAAVGPPDVVRALLRAGADVNARDDEGRSALGYAEQFNERSEGERLEVISLLKRAGAKE